jgi:hypothetical protein
MSTVKLRSTDKPQKPADKLKSGLPGSPEERRAKTKAAIAANRETLRRLAK